jgi:hypothetical protein
MTTFTANYPDTYLGLPMPLDMMDKPGSLPVRGYSLADIQQQYPYLPSQSVMIGIAEDERPILFDLTDPTTGALISISQERALNQQFFQSILANSTAYNRPAEVSHVIFTSHTEAWQRLAIKSRACSHSMGIFNLHERETAGQIMQWAHQVEQRYNGRATGTAMLLVFDDLRFLQKADYDVRVNFGWLLQNGPGVQVWPLSGISSGDIPMLGDWMAYFQRRIFGPVVKNRLVARDEDISMLNSLVPGKQFAIQYHSHWVKFWLPS